jgi:hypothetical protein
MGNWKKMLEANTLSEDERNLTTPPTLKTQRHNACMIKK